MHISGFFCKYPLFYSRSTMKIFRLSTVIMTNVKIHAFAKNSSLCYYDIISLKGGDLMKSDYSRDIFKQLEETMKRLDKMESTLENTKIEHKIEIGHLNDKIDSLEKENAALKIENTRLKDDNERLRRIINNDSTNSSLPLMQFS